LINIQLIHAANWVSVIKAKILLSQVLSRLMRQLSIVRERPFSMLMFVQDGLPHQQLANKHLFQKDNRAFCTLPLLFLEAATAMNQGINQLMQFERGLLEMFF